MAARTRTGRAPVQPCRPTRRRSRGGANARMVPAAAHRRMSWAARPTRRAAASERDKVEVESILNDGPGLDRPSYLVRQPKSHRRGHYQRRRVRIGENLKGFRERKRHYRGSIYDSDFHALQLYVNVHFTAHGLLLVPGTRNF